MAYLFFLLYSLPAVENKIPDVNTLTKKADYDAKKYQTLKKIYFTTSHYNKIMNNMLHAKKVS